MSQKVKVPCNLPARENARVYKEECVFCFQTPEHEDGLYVSLTNHLGYCPIHLKKLMEMHQANGNPSFGNGGYLHVQRTRRRVSKGGEPEQKITKLAIGVEGGLQEAKFDFDEKYELAVFPGPVKYQLTDPNLDEGVRSCCDALIACESATRLQELESLAGQWDGSAVIPTKHMDLPQLTPAPKIPPTGWRCQIEGCDKTENLWLNLTDGKIFCGRRFYDGTGGNNHAIDHYKTTGFPLAVKLGTITPHGTADVYSYDEDEMVVDPKLEEHLAHFGINMKAMEKTEKTMLELELDLNQKYEFSRIQETGRDLKPVYGPGFTGLVNLGSSCYMNSVLQTLTLVPEVQRVFSGDAANRIYFAAMNNSIAPNPTENLQLQFAKLFDGLLSGQFSKPPPEKTEGDIVLPDSSVRPLTFRTLIGKGHPEFSSRRQQDVEEYLRHVFDKLEQLKEIGGDSIIDAFRFEVLEKLHCQATDRDAKSRRPETILSLSVPMEKATNLDEVRAFEEKRKTAAAASRKVDDAVFAKVPLKACLEAYAAPSIIEGARSPFDDKLPTVLSKTQRLVTFPDYLLVQLKKFTVADDWTPKKLEVEIILDDDLNIEDLGVPPGSPDLIDRTEASTPPPRPKTPPPSPAERAAMTQLTDAGFPLNACRKAWQQSGGRVDVAFEWLLSHSQDVDFDQPAPAAAAHRPPPQANEESISNITSMGFTRDQARKALRLANDNFEQAIGWLLDNPGDPGEPEQAAPSTPQRGEAAATKYRNGPGKYRLIGFISHMGSSTHSGHYVCHLLKEVPGVGRRWVIYNDEKVALSEEPPKGFGYVYLYERVK